MNPRHILKSLGFARRESGNPAGRARLDYRKKFGKRKGIAEIIAALLLILISVAAAAVVYTYVLNFVGNVSQNNGSNLSQISIDNFCVSATLSCNAVSSTGTSYYVVIRNTGSSSIPITSTSEPSLYFKDATSGTSFTALCNSPPVTVSPGSTFVCYSSSRNAIGTVGGDTILLKVVNPDGGTTLSSTKGQS